MVRRRLDAELVRRGLAKSRQQAADLVAAGKVSVSGTVAAKVATQVESAAPIVVSHEDANTYASRGAGKLLGALAQFEPQGLVVSGRRCLDAGASTGGFTDVLLRAGAVDVVAVDVGYGQLVWRLQNDERVKVLDRTNVRDLTVELLGHRVDLVVADLSFISLRLVLGRLFDVTGEDADVLAMVKPQFEVGRERLPAGGVVRDPGLRAESIMDVAGVADRLGWGVRDVTASPVPGPAGNVEYFVWLRVDAGVLSAEAARHAVEVGPA